jgi:hypothetical protein
MAIGDARLEASRRPSGDVKVIAISLDAVEIQLRVRFNI